MPAELTYTPDSAPWLTFTWQGGEYIDITPEGSEYATDVINVWDSSKDAAEIPFTPEAFEKECDTWVKDNQD